MARAKAGTKAGDAATRKWRQTMLDKFGSEEKFKEHFRAMGKKGGENGRGPDYKGGFAGNHALAVLAGAKGGRISRRTKRIYSDIDKAEEILNQENGRA